VLFLYNFRKSKPNRPQCRELNLFARNPVHTKLYLTPIAIWLVASFDAIGTVTLSADKTTTSFITDFPATVRSIGLNSKTLTVNSSGSYGYDIVGPGVLTKTGTSAFTFSGIGANLTTLTASGVLTLDGALVQTGAINVTATTNAVAIGATATTQVSCTSINISNSTNVCIGTTSALGTIVGTGALGSSATGENRVYVGTNSALTSAGRGILSFASATVGEKSTTTIYLAGNSASSYGYFIIEGATTITTNGTIHIGYGTTGTGSLTVGGALTCNGKIICNKHGTDGFLVHGLSGTTTTAEITLNNTSEMVIDGGGTYAGKFTGVAASKITKNGSADLTLSGASGFSGTFYLTAGNLILQNNLGSGTISVATGRTLKLDCSGSVTYASVITGTGTLQKTLAGTATLTGTMTGFTGAITVTSGTLTRSGAIGTTSSTGAVTIQEAGTLSTNNILGNGTITINSGTSTKGKLQLTGTATYGNTITGTGNIEKTGANTTSTLSGTMTGFTGAITVTSGTLSRSGAIGTTSSTGAVTIEAAGMLTTNNILGNGEIEIKASGSTKGKLTLTGATISYANLIKGAGTLESSGTNTLTGTMTAFTGDINITSGTLTRSGAIGTNGTSGSTGKITITAGAALTTNNILGNGEIEIKASGSTKGKLTLTGATISYANLITGAGTLESSGTNTLSGTMTGFTGDINVASGTLTRNGAIGTNGTGGSTGVVTIQAGGTLATNNILGNGTITINSNTSTKGKLQLTGTATYGNTITGTGNIEKTGADTTSTLSGTISGFTGTVTVTTGTLVTNNQIGASGITIGTAGTLEAKHLLGSGTIDNSGLLVINSSQTYGNTITGTGALDNTGGTATLSGTLTYSGVTSVLGGKLITNNAMSTSGVIIANGTTLEAKSTLGTGAIANAGSLILNNATDTIHSNATSGSGTLEKTGAGKATLTGTSTLSGNATITNGTLQLNAALGTGGITNNSALILNNTADLTYANSTISGTGTLQKIGGYTATLSGTLTYAGATTVSAGKLITNNAMSTSGITIASGATLEAKSTLGTGAIENNGNLILAGAVTYTNALTSTGTLTRDGSGTAQLATITSLTGDVTVSNGILKLGGFTTTGKTLNVTSGTCEMMGAQNYQYLKGGGTIDIKSFNLVTKDGTSTTQADLTFTGTLTGTGTYTHSGSNWQALNTASASSIGKLDVTGNLDIGKSGSGTLTATTVDVGGKLVVGSGSGGNGTLTATTVNVNNIMYVAINAATGAMTATNVYVKGSLYIAAESSVANTRGTVTVNDSITIDQNKQVVIGNTLSTGKLLVTNTMDNNGTVTVSALTEVGGFSVGGLTGSGTIALNGNSMTIVKSGTTYSGTFTGTDAAAINKGATGDLTLTGASSGFTGKVTVADGTLSLTNSLGAKQIVITAGTVNLNLSADKSYVANISGNGSLTKTGESKATLTGALTYTGGTSVTGGTLEVQQSLGGNISVASGTTLILNNANTYTAASPAAYGALANAGALTKNGDGVASFATVSSNTGNVTVSKGTLELGGFTTTGKLLTVTGSYKMLGNQTYQSLTGGGSVNLNGKTLSITCAEQAEAQRTFSGTLTGGGTIDVLGSEYTLNTQSSSSIDTLNVKAQTVVGANATGTLTTNDLNVTAWLRIGSGASGTINATTVSLTVGSVDVGAYTTTGTVGTLAVSDSMSTASGTTVTVGSNVGTGTFTVANTLTNHGAIVINQLTSGNEKFSVGGLTGGGGVTLNGTSAMYIKNGSSQVFSGKLTSIAGTTLVKDGSGTQTLSGAANDHKGSTTINAGVLIINHNMGSGGVLVNANGTLTLDTGADSRTYLSAITGTGILKKVSSGTATISGASGFTGSIAIDGGALKSTTSLGDVGIAISANCKFILDNASAQDYLNRFSGAGTLEKTAAGVATLKVANDVSGKLDITGGGVILDNILGTAEISIAADKSLTLNNAANLTYNNQITGTGLLTKTNAGTATLTKSVAVKTATVSNGTLSVGNTFNSGALFVAGGTLNITAGTTTVTGATTLSSGTMTTSSTFNSGSLGVTGGTFNIAAGTTTVSGATTMSGGAINANSAFNSGSLGITGGAFTANAATTITNAVTISTGTFTVASGVTGSAGTMSMTSGSLNVYGALSSNSVTISGGILGIENGSLTVSGHVDFTGGTFNEFGTFSAGSVNLAQGQLVTVGRATAPALAATFEVTEELRCDGTLTIDKTASVDACNIKGLTGAGTININGGSTLKITYVNGPVFSGTFKDTSNTGTLYFTDCSGSGQIFNTSADSNVAQLTMDYSNLFLGRNGTGKLTCVSVDVINNGGLHIGSTSSTSNGTLVCENMSINGRVSVGSHAAIGGLTCNNTITQAGGNLYVGTYEGVQCPGNGILNAKSLVINGGTVHIAHIASGATGNANIETLTVGSAAEVRAGWDSAKIANSSLVVSKLATCNGKIYAGIAKLEFAGIEGSGTAAEIALRAGTLLDITNKDFQNTESHTYAGKITESNGACSLAKNGAGTQILSGGTSTYTGGTSVNAGVLCGEISFNGALAIAEVAKYRLAKNTSGTTNSINGTLLGALSGGGTLDLANGCFGLRASSTFDGAIINSNTVETTSVIKIDAKGVQFYARGQVHDIIGTIEMTTNCDGNNCALVSGFFPNCYLSTGSGRGIDATGGVSFKGINGGICHLTGDGDLLITYGNSLDSYDVAKVYYKWSSHTGITKNAFAGSITKEGAGRQILQYSDADALPTHAGATTIKGGVLAGVLSPNAPLDIRSGATYQISCWNSASNLTGVTAQTVKGLTGAGNINLSPNGSTVDVLTLKFTGVETFSGAISAGKLIKMGDGTQTFTGASNTLTDTTISGGKLILTQTYGTGTIVNNAALELSNAGAVTYNNVISGNSSATLAKIGAGKTTLTTASSFAGTTTVSNGLLVLNDTLGSGGITVNSSLEFNHDTDVIRTNVISGAGTLAKTGTGMARLTASSSLTGAATISAGILSLEQNLGTGNIANNSVLNLHNSLEITHTNIVSGTGKLTKTNGGNAILTNASNSYTGGTEISTGKLCGYIGFNSTLSIASGAFYRLAQNSDGTTDSSNSITATLSKAISGSGTLDLAQGSLTVTTSSTFDGQIVNTNTDPSKVILIIDGSNTVFNAGVLEDSVSGASLEHTAIGTITYTASGKQTIAGNFPHCYLHADSGSSVVSASQKQAVFAGLSDISNAIHLIGSKALIITEGATDFRRTTLSCNWTDIGTFTGQIIKRGVNRQILYERYHTGNANYAKDAQTHRGETRVEGGTLAGVLSPNAPLFVEDKATYQICCYNGTDNRTGITAQQVKGLYGAGDVELGDCDANKNGTNVIKDGTLTVSVDGTNSFQFDGQLKGKTYFTKVGDGRQVVSTAQANFTGGILVKNAGVLEFAQFTGNDYRIELQDSANYKMLGNQNVGAIQSGQTTTTFDVNSNVLTLVGQDLSYNGKIIDTANNGKIYLNKQGEARSQILNTQVGSAVRTIEVDNGTLYIGGGHDGVITTAQTTLTSGALYVGVGSNGTLNATNVNMAAGTISVGSSSGNGRIATTNFTMDSGTTIIGAGGAGTLQAMSIVLKSGNFNVGATDSAATGGTVTTNTMSIDSGASVLFGNNAGTGSFTATGEVACAGTVTVDKLVGGNSFVVKKLTGGGNLHVNNGNTITLKGITWTGTISDNTNTGTILIQNERTTDNGYKINSQNGSKIGTLRLDNGLVSIGLSGTGDLTCKTVTLVNDSKLLVGDAGTGTLKCDTMDASGVVSVGSNGAQIGTLTCTDAITFRGSQFCVGTDGCDSAYGKGSVTCKMFNALSGTVYIANANSTASSAVVTVSGDFNLSNGASLNMGGANVVDGVTTRLPGLVSSLTVNDSFTCDGTVLSLASLFSIGGLKGSGSVKVYNGSSMFIIKGMNNTYNGIIWGQGSVEKSGSGTQVFAGATSTYTGGTTVSGGILCGEIGFGGALAISSGATYRMARNLSDPVGSPDVMVRALVGALTGTGKLNLAHSHLTLQATSIFDGQIVNDNQDPFKTILTVEGTTNLDAGAITNATTGTSLEHTAIGTIVYGSGNPQRISGNFPKCYLHGQFGGSIIDMSSKQAVFAGLHDDGGAIHLHGSKALIITDGFALNDFRRSIFSCNYSADRTFTGQIIKRGSKRQISYSRNDAKDTPTHTGETRVEGGVFAGVVSPNAPLFIENGAVYQISCYNGATNTTNVVTQTVKGLRGNGLVELAEAGKAQDTLKIDVNSGVSETFAGRVTGNGVLTKIGAGTQIITGELLNPQVNVDGGRLAFVSIVDGPKQVNITTGTLAVSGGLRNTTLNLNAATSVFNVAAMQNIELNINANKAGATIGTEAASRVLSNVNVVEAVNINTNHDLRIDGRFRGAGTIQKIGAQTLTLGEVHARESTSMIEVNAGTLNISSKADLGEHMGLKVNSVANLYSNQTFRTLGGTGTIYMHDYNIDLKLDSNITYSGNLVGDTAHNVVNVYGKATFAGNSLQQHSGWLASQQGSTIQVTSATNASLKLRLEKDSHIEMSGNHTFNGVEGSGTLHGEVGSEHVINTDRTQTFIGDVIGPKLTFTGAQTFHWGGAGTKLHAGGIDLGGSAKLMVAKNTFLSAQERISLDTPTSQLWLESPQIISVVSGSGTVYASNIQMTLTESATFSGDFVGQGEVVLTADHPVEYTLMGARKSFKGRFVTDGNVKLVYPQEIFDPSVIVSGQATVLTEDKTFNGTQLAEVINLGGNVAKIEDTEGIISSEFIKGPGTVQVNCEKTLSVVKGVVGTEPVTFNVDKGMVIAESSAKLENSIINLNGDQSTVEFRSSGNLTNTSLVRTTTDTGILQFAGAAPISNSATFEINQSTRFKTLVNTTLLGEMRGHGEVRKEGAGVLQVNETDARVWIVNEGTLKGTFNADSSVQLADKTTLAITQNQTLRSLNTTASTAQMSLSGKVLTLTDRSQYGGNFYATGHLEIAEGAEFAILGGTRNCMHIDVYGTLQIADAAQSFQITGTGAVVSDHNVTLNGDVNRTFTGIWRGNGDITHTGNRIYTIGADLQAHTGNFYISQGTVILTEEARLGVGLLQVTNSVLVPCVNENINGVLALKNATVRTSTNMHIERPVSVDNAATFEVQDKTLVLDRPINNRVQINKSGAGALHLYGDYEEPVSLVVKTGDVEIYGKLHSGTQLDITGVCAIQEAQEILDIRGTGTLALLDDITLNSSTPITFAGKLVGANDLILAEGTSVSFTNTAWNESFIGRIVLSANSTLNLFGNQAIRQIDGTGTLNMHNSDLTMAMNADQNFYGTFENMGALTFSGNYTFAMRTELNCSQLLVNQESTLSAERQVTFESLDVEGNVIFGKSSYGKMLRGDGIVTLGENLSLDLPQDCTFDGDIVGAQTLNLSGAGQLTLNETKSFTGMINVKNAALNLSADSVLSDHSVANIDVGCILRINSDQALSDVIGHGLVNLQGHTLRLLQNTDHGEHFHGDLTNGTLLVDSSSVWFWEGAAKAFNGVLNVTEQSHVVLQNITSLEAVVLICDGEIEATAPIVLKTLQGSGTFKHAEACSVSQDSVFAGNIDGSGLFKVTGGRFVWSGAYKSPSGLEIKSIFEALSKLDRDDTVILHDNAELNIMLDQEFTNLQGTGVLNANEKHVSLLGKVSFEGKINDTSEIVIQGSAAVADISNCYFLSISENSSLILNASRTGLQQLALFGSNSLLSLLAAETTCELLTGRGRINCNGNALVLSAAEYPSEFNGDIDGGMLILIDHELRLSGTGAKSLIGEICLRGHSVLDVDSVISMDGNEVITLEQDAQLNMHGIQYIGRVQGAGDITFDELIFQHESGFVFDGRFVSNGNLTFRNDDELSGTVTLSGNSELFEGDINCDGLTVEMLGTCAWHNQSLTLHNHANLILHASSTLHESSTIVISGQNTLRLCEDSLNLSQSILIRSGSELVVDAICQGMLSGEINGAGTLTKIGNDVLNIDGKSDFSGIYDIQKGILGMRGEATHKFGINVDEDGRVNVETNVLLHTLSGRGTVTLEANSSAKLYVTGDTNINASVMNGRFEVLTDTSGTKNVTFDGDLNAETLKIGDNVAFRASKMGSCVNADIWGTLACDIQDFLSLNVTGNVDGTDLSILESGVDSIVRGRVHAGIIRTSSKFLGLLGDVQLDNLEINQGITLINHTAKIQNAKVAEDSTLYAVGALESLNLTGTVVPGRLQEYLSEGESLFGALSVKDVSVNVGAVLRTRLDCGNDEHFYGGLQISNSAKDLDNLSIVLDAERLSEIEQREFVLMTLPPNQVQEQLPHIDFEAGLCPLIEAPQESLSLTVVQDKLILRTGKLNAR
jgi:autotransporter-associated beta strand protein